MNTQPRKDLQVSQSQRGQVTILTLAGDLDVQSLPRVRQALAEAMDAGRLKVLIDAAKVDYIDSSGLGLLIGTLKRIKELGGALKLVGLNAYMLGIFRLIHLDYVLETFDNLEKALASFEPATATRAGR